MLAGDLSGIQHSLFLLASQRVKGVNRILRARSFVFGALTEAAAMAARRAFDLPVFSLVQSAGGRFMLLIANTDDCAAKVDALRTEIDPWMMKRYRGELALNLALGEPFSGEDFSAERLPEVMRQLGEAVDESKLRAFSQGYQAVHQDAVYQEQACQACGLRPDEHVERTEDGDERRLCGVCRDEQRLGSVLPKIRYLAWRRDARRGERSLEFFGGLGLEWIGDEKPRTHDALSVIRVYRGTDTEPRPYALRFLANYVPLLEPKDLDDTRYEAVAREAERETQRQHVGDIKTFEHLAAAALRMENGERLGQPLLGVLKADVDWLGFVFGQGMERSSLSRVAALSRAMDFFFTGYLHHVLENGFRNTYTVYAGGDDLLMIGPWDQALELARELRRQFGLWTGGNPNLTLSAAVELMKVNHPINRAVREAEDRLERAKRARGDDGMTVKDHICAIAEEPVTWRELERQLENADTLSGYLRQEWLSQVFVYRLLAFDALRRRAEFLRKPGEPVKVDLEAASWRAKWGYQLARHVRDGKTVPPEKKDEVTRFLNGLLGLDLSLQRTKKENPSPRIAVSVALYRNRKYTERR